MSQQIFNNGDTGLQARNKINANFTELYTDKAPIASPALTGNPTAPTQLTSDNSTRIATTAFVKALIDGVLAGAPGALDTLDELAAALGDDANFAATITNALALRAPLASPALTGNPTAPTQTSGNNSTRLATTEFVQTAAAQRLATAGGSMAGSASFQGATSVVVANATSIGLTTAQHRELTLAAATGAVTCTIERAPGRVTDNYGGAILVTQHATTSRALSFLLLDGTVKWCGSAPDFAAMTPGSQRLISFIVFGASNLIVLADCGAVA